MNDEPTEYEIFKQKVEDMQKNGEYGSIGIGAGIYVNITPEVDVEEVLGTVKKFYEAENLQDVLSVAIEMDAYNRKRDRSDEDE